MKTKFLENSVLLIGKRKHYYLIKKYIQTKKSFLCQSLEFLSKENIFRIKNNTIFPEIRKDYLKTQNMSPL